MKIYSHLLFFLFMICSFSVFSNETILDNSELMAIFKVENADHLLLIGFSDKTINRIQAISYHSPYRRRGKYSSSSWSLRITNSIENDYGLHKLTEWPMTTVGIHCAVFQVPENLSIEKILQQLKQDKRIQIVQKMNFFNTKMHQYNDPYLKLQSNIVDLQIRQVHKISTGRHITIAVIDTGVDTHHPDLVGQIKIKKNLVSGISSGFAEDVHGTAVTGIMVARADNHTGIIGVAPNAGVLALKACWPKHKGALAASCNSFTLALAVDMAIKLGADVLNMSLTGPYDPLLEKLLNKAMAEGIIVVAADPGAAQAGGRFPASLKNVVSVQTLQRVASSQSINAPGTGILTTMPYGTYDFVSGSSLSAAQISGIIALLKELKPDLNSAEVFKILHKSKSETHQSKVRSVKFGVSATKAVNEVCKLVSCT